MGSGGQTVVRGGFSLVYSRMGMGTYAGIFNGNPGSFITATRNVNLGNLVYAGESWPLLFRENDRLGAPAFQKTPVYPMKGAISDSVTIIDPHLRTPYATSWSFGIQRELSRSMVMEVRYVGTRGLQIWTEYDLNERNIVENGMLDEFKLAMANLQANIAGGRGNNFTYYGPGTGTAPLPITLAYFSGHPKALASDQSKYTSTNFTSSTFVDELARMNPDPYGYAASLWSDSGPRANAAKAGLPANIFIVNPSLRGGANIAGNGGITWYDSMVVELRRRMSKSLLVQANYVWAKSFDSTRLSLRRDRVKDLGNTAPHASRYAPSF